MSTCKGIRGHLNGFIEVLERVICALERFIQTLERFILTLERLDLNYYCVNTWLAFIQISKKK